MNLKASKAAACDAFWFGFANNVLPDGKQWHTRELTDGERFIDCLRTPSKWRCYGEICMKATYIEQLMARREDREYRKECERIGLRYI